VTLPAALSGVCAAQAQGLVGPCRGYPGVEVLIQTVCFNSVRMSSCACSLMENRHTHYNNTLQRDNHNTSTQLTHVAHTCADHRKTCAK
jgi:hypothetical protein